MVGSRNSSKERSRDRDRHRTRERGSERDRDRRSRSSSRDRERHRRRRSRSTSSGRGRWQLDGSRSPVCARRRSRSRSRSRGWRRYSRSPSPYQRRRSFSPPLPQDAPPWAPGPGSGVPPWHRQSPPYQPGPQHWHPPDAAAGHSPRYDHGREGDEHRWGRSRSRGSDTDRDWGTEDRGRRGGGFGPVPEIPTASVFIKGLPPDADESDIYAAFSAFPNIHSVKVLRDRASGRGKGSAFLDFVSPDDARVLMESEARYNMMVGGHLLFLDYSSGPPVGGSGSVGAPALDWICDMCNSVNFARRLECYHCSSSRPANPRRVTTDLNEPSHILKVSGLEPHVSEADLHQALSALTPSIMDLRVIKDKYTGAPRGFAFVELPSVAAAGSLMLACQGMLLPGQSTPIKVCYAKAKEKVLGAASVPGAPAEGLQRAAEGPAAEAAVGAPGHAAEPEALAGPLGWKPKEFNPDALQASEQQGQPQQQQQQQQPDKAAGDEAGGASVRSAAAVDASSGAAAAEAAGVDPATVQALTQAGFEYHATSGYWWDAKSGYFYDARTQLYYHHSTNQWYQYNHATGEYTAVGGAEQQQQQQQQQQHQGQEQQQPSQQEGQGPQQKQASVADKRRRAVIGSAPQYNPEGLLAAAALAEEREAEQRRIAAAKAARDRQQLQQNKHASKQPKLMAGKPGIGVLPGTAGPPVASTAPPPAAQVVAEGSVQGVVYRSKWSQQRAAQQAAQ